MKIKTYVQYVGDFETTVYPGQTETEVWAASCVEIGTEDVHIFHSIDEQYRYLMGLRQNVIIYYHNLKFDGSFWIDYLMRVLKYTQAYEEEIIDNKTSVRWLHDKDMPCKSYKYTISDKGQWYSIVIRTGKHYIEIRDSLKLLPFSVKQIGKAFATKHQKLEMEYTGFRYAGCEITDEERQYIANDVLVVAEALKIMQDEGHNSTTIGSCCLKEFQRMYDKTDYAWMFPNLYEEALPNGMSAGEYIRKSYRGGWCYLVKGKEGKVFKSGCTLDVNSLYPSMMSSESGNRYPIGKPIYWEGNYIPDEAQKEDKYYFVRIRTRFQIKPGYLPFIQIKNSHNYRGTECLETTDVYNAKTGKYCSKYIGLDGLEHDTIVELVLTCVDYKLFLEHYDTYDLEILDGVYFYTMAGIFDNYIEKYKKIKLESKGAKRTLAKLFLNNLYGKMATSIDSSFKLAYMKDDDVVGFYPIHAEDKTPGYIPIGSAITSYSRNFTIRAAQKNFHGAEPGFIYADTDSIHCDMQLSDVRGVTVHDKNFCCWKAESCWDEAIYVRQKTYIEHVTHENMEQVSEPYYDVKCAGMPDKSKCLFLASMSGDVIGDTEEERKFCETRRTIKDFRVGLKVPGKLMPKRIKGGIVLVDTSYEMR